ncbi:transmembrane protein [Mycobacterium tuberculosis variant africanum]|nr:transmembrane protein [Mycobacterium tuberculosis variant africanum]
MGWFSAPEYWLGRLALERGTAIIYLIAFVAAAQQFRPLIGEHGMLPVPRYLAGQSFWRTPSIFHFRYSDRVFAGSAGWVPCCRQPSSPVRPPSCRCGPRC